ncbi:MAG: hypothetical protein LC099_02750 [Anaerolineales bacterium]|nr:hypothetical protein [Anaerolineales bacterium]
MTTLFAAFCILVSTASLTWGYAQAGYENAQRWILTFGALWLFALWRKWKFFSAPAALLTLALAMFGVWFKFAAGWMLSGALFAILAWDLTEFRRKLNQLSARDDAKGVERRHLARVAFLAAGGILIALSLIFLR